MDLARLLELAERGLTLVGATGPAARPSDLPEGPVSVGLSRRQQSVLEALAGTASRQAIANSLFISVNTVKSHLASIYKKLGTTSRAETLARARQQALLPSAEAE